MNLNGIFVHFDNLNPIALRMPKTLRSFGHFECNRVKAEINCDKLMVVVNNKFTVVVLCYELQEEVFCTVSTNKF